MERSLATALGVDKQLNSYDKESKTVAKDAVNPVPPASTAGMTTLEGIWFLQLLAATWWHQRGL